MAKIDKNSKEYKEWVKKTRSDAEKDYLYDVSRAGGKKIVKGEYHKFIPVKKRLKKIETPVDNTRVQKRKYFNNDYEEGK